MEDRTRDIGLAAIVVGSLVRLYVAEVLDAEATLSRSRSPRDYPRSREGERDHHADRARPDRRRQLGAPRHLQTET
jgi:hypothetical protein